jgi:hypothetical protein
MLLEPTEDADVRDPTRGTAAERDSDGASRSLCVEARDDEHEQEAKPDEGMTHGVVLRCKRTAPDDSAAVAYEFVVP